MASSDLQLYTYANNTKAFKALIAAEYVGVDVELPAFTMGVTNKTAEFLAANPTGKVPSLHTSHGVIFESNAIARYIARLNSSAQLLGSSNIDQAHVDQWIDFIANELEPVTALWLYPIYGYTQYNGKVYIDAKAAMITQLTVLNTHLLSNTYLVGQHITLADIILTTVLLELYKRVFTPEFIAPFTNVTRHFNTLINQQQVSAVIGHIQFATTEEIAAGAKKVEKVVAPKAEKPAAAAAAPVEAAAAPVVDRLAEYEDAQAAAKKTAPKSKLDLLPETKMDLDTVKRAAFSVRPFNTNFFEELTELWDEGGWAWWTASYKYNEENQVLYMTGNLVGGFLQRCDAVRKYSMGVLNIIGHADEETAPFPVVGVFMFRGNSEVPEEMLLDNPDSEYYTWTKVDFVKDQALIKSHFVAEEVNGLKVLDRRYFK